LASPLRWICLSIALSLLLPGVAQGQVRAAALARMKLLNKKAMDEYDSLEFDAAKGALLEALAVADNASIKRGRTLTSTYLNLGIVFGAGLNDRINAIKYFTAALRINRRAALNPTRATPNLEEMFKSARENLQKEPIPPKRAVFRHKPIDEAVAGRRIKLYVRVHSSLAPSQVLLYYRSTGASEYSERVMREVKSGVYLGVIPAEEVEGRSVHYYLEARNEAGGRIAGHGTAESPNIISLRKGRRGPGRRKPREPEPSPSKVFSIGLMVGAGVGVVNGGQSEHEHPQSIPNSQKTVEINPGGALTPFHIAPELIYHLNDSWHLGVLGRIQVVNAISADVPDSKISWLGEARAKRFFGSGALRFYMAFGAGAGQIRHRIPLGDYDENPATPDDRIDTRIASIVAFGLGGGMSYMFSDYVGFVIELNGLIVVPTFAANLDLNSGLLLSF
jgi:hypothetical protein